MEPKITLPIVHLNGTSARDLTEGYLNAANKVGEAIAALRQIEFNARDYYLIGGAWDSALAEMAARVVKLHEVKNDFERIAEQCSYFIKP
jgi:hypothetical protein